MIDNGTWNARLPCNVEGSLTFVGAEFLHPAVGFNVGFHANITAALILLKNKATKGVCGK